MAEKREDQVRYICPICEKELKYGTRFCWNCKSRVEPWKYTGGLLPNESHSVYHMPQTYMKPRSEQGQHDHMYNKRHQPKQYTYNSPNPAAGQTQPPQNPYGSSRGKNPYGSKSSRKGITGCGSLIVVLVIFWIMIQFLIGIMM